MFMQNLLYTMYYTKGSSIFYLSCPFCNCMHFCGVFTFSPKVKDWSALTGCFIRIQSASCCRKITNSKRNCDFFSNRKHTYEICYLPRFFERHFQMITHQAHNSRAKSNQRWCNVMTLQRCCINVMTLH